MLHHSLLLVLMSMFDWTRSRALWDNPSLRFPPQPPKLPQNRVEVWVNLQAGLKVLNYLLLSASMYCWKTSKGCAPINGRPLTRKVGVLPTPNDCEARVSV